MLAMTMRLNDSEDWVVIRDDQGRRLCEISITEVGHGRVVLAYDAPPDVQINRRPLDRKKFPDDYPETDTRHPYDRLKDEGRI